MGPHLSSLRLKNFKCFKKASFSFGKITLITGPNSSGKSSVIYGLLGALQTDSFPFTFSPNGDLINLGDFEEIAFNHTARSFGLGLDFSDGTSVDAEFKCTNGAPDLKKLQARTPGLHLSVQRPSRGSAYELRYRQVKDEDEDTEKFGKQFGSAFKIFMAEFSRELESDGKNAKKRAKVLAGFSWENAGASGRKTLVDIERPTEHLRSNFPLWQRTHKIEQTGKVFRNQCNYISAFRLPPERTYYARTRSTLKVEKYGENAIDQVLRWVERVPAKITLLNSALQKLQISDSLGIIRHGGGRFEVRVKTDASGVQCSLPDVGFGVSQFLPIIVADLQLPDGGTLIVSQPEIHLHPSSQAEYADYIVGESSSGKRRYIIETHSEYLINRLRLRIAKGDIDPKDVKVYFITSKKGNASVNEVTLEKDGRITGAPADFFSTYLLDTLELAMES